MGGVLTPTATLRFPVVVLKCLWLDTDPVSRFGLAVRLVRLVSRETSVPIRFGSPFSSKVAVCGHRLFVTLSLTINETLNGSHRCPS